MTESYYTATISHHSVGRAREIEIHGSLDQAKRRAMAEFGDGYADHEIIIRAPDGYTVARRKVGERRWRS